MTMQRRLFIGVHRDTSWPWGPLIDSATRLRFSAAPGVSPRDGWLFDGGPPTHAFVVVKEAGESGPMRIDAEPPHTHKRAYLPILPTRLWELLGHDLDAAVELAWSSLGMPYDVVQLLEQAWGPVHAHLQLPALSGYRGVRGGGVICTEAACRILACHNPDGARVADNVMEADHYPYELGLALHRLGHTEWLCPVDHVTLEPRT